MSVTSALRTGILSATLTLASLLLAPHASSRERASAEQVLLGIGEEMAVRGGVIPRSELLETLSEAFAPYGSDDACLDRDISYAEFPCGSDTPCRLSGGIYRGKFVLGVEDAYFVASNSEFWTRLAYELGDGGAPVAIPSSAQPYLDDLVDAVRLYENAYEHVASRLDEESSGRARAHVLLGYLERHDPSFSDVREALLSGKYDWRSSKQDLALEMGRGIFENIGLFDESQLPEGFARAGYERKMEWRGCNPLRRTTPLESSQ